jgi:hypothetical protein
MPSGDAAYGTIAVGAAATLIVAARGRRESIIIQNNHATQTLHIGDDDQVTTATGLKLAAGASVTLDGYQGAVYGIGSGAGTTTNYFESF